MPAHSVRIPPQPCAYAVLSQCSCLLCRTCAWLVACFAEGFLTTQALVNGGAAIHWLVDRRAIVVAEFPSLTTWKHLARTPLGHIPRVHVAARRLETPYAWFVDYVVEHMPDAVCNPAAL
eukprot:4916866-Amphidinium_carterae.4